MPSRPVLYLMLAIAALVAFLVFAGPAACERIRSLTAQSKNNVAQHGALQNSAADAVVTQGDVATNQTASEDLTRKHAEEINNAKGANDPVNPELADTGLRAFCSRKASRNLQRCRVFQPH